MARKTHLKGEIDGPSGQAPRAAWTAVDAEVKRTEDVWISGDPATLLAQQRESWTTRITERVQVPDGHAGLRIRFVRTSDSDKASLDLLALVQAVLEAIPQVNSGLFVHAEVMFGPESGLYLAFENRPPALMTQVHLGDETAEGQLTPVSGPLHLNLLLHDVSQGFSGAIEAGTVQEAVRRLSEVGSGIDLANVHELSIARSDSHSSGISVGVEQISQEQGSAGGFSAADEGSRATLTVSPSDPAAN